jgi:hypothetical protein
MKKIPSLFQRNYDGDCLVRDEVVPGSEWVLAGEGVPTRKYDGAACMVKDGALWKRYDCKLGRKIPHDFLPCEVVPDKHTGHWPGWVPVGDGPDDKWHREALSWAFDRTNGVLVDGTYELCGRKIQGDPEGFRYHVLVPHGWGGLLKGCPRTFDGIKAFLSDGVIEGIVWHHPDGRMVKIKGKDFGFLRRKK